MKSTPNSRAHFEEFPGAGRRRGSLSGGRGRGRDEEILLIGAEFETPAKIPFMVSGRYRWLPGIAREWMRAAYGLTTLLFEKLSASKNQAFIDLVGQVRLQAKQMETLERRIAVLESGSAVRPARKRKRT